MRAVRSIHLKEKAEPGSKIDSKPKQVKKTIKTPIKKEKSRPKIIKTKITVFRSNSQVLSQNDVKNMLKKYDFFCRYPFVKEDFKEADFESKIVGILAFPSKGIFNPHGRGFENDFVFDKNRYIVYDRNSGLMWQQSGSAKKMSMRCALKQFNKNDVKDYIDELNKKRFAGFKDWRLPTLEEAMSLIAPTKKRNLYIHPIFDSKQEDIWTADQLKTKLLMLLASLGEIKKAPVYVKFEWGCFMPISDISESYVRAVRSIQSSLE